MLYLSQRHNFVREGRLPLGVPAPRICLVITLTVPILGGPISTNAAKMLHLNINLYSKYISRTFDKTITRTLLGQTSQVFQQLSQLLVLWVGATLVLRGQLSLGQLIAFRIISGYVTQPILRLSSIWQNLQELKVSFERLSKGPIILG